MLGGLSFWRELFGRWERLPQLFQLHYRMLRPLFGDNFWLNMTLLMVFPVRNKAQPRNGKSRGITVENRERLVRLSWKCPLRNKVVTYLFQGHISCIPGPATIQRGAMEITNRTQLATQLRRPQPRYQPRLQRPQHQTAATLASAKRTVNWATLLTLRTVASIN